MRFRRSPRTLERRVGAEVLVMTTDGPDVHELSGGAVAVWEELGSPRTVLEIVDRLAAEHAVESAEIAEQVRGCVDQLVGLGLVEELIDA
ncbi:MAG TPA: PqqD family protein [Actinomycetota bacterium]